MHFYISELIGIVYSQHISYTFDQNVLFLFSSKYIHMRFWAWLYFESVGFLNPEIAYVISLFVPQYPIYINHEYKRFFWKVK